MTPLLRLVFESGTTVEVLPMCQWDFVVTVLGVTWGLVAYAFIRRRWPLASRD